MVRAEIMTATDTHMGLRALADELARCGVRHAATSPGSRSAPLVLALAAEPRIACHSHIDERCAGFFALGVAKASGMPAVVACTSGTAAANLLPAVAEAREARVPLIVLTADRPPELRDAGAGQTIDQLGLYGGRAAWFFEVGNHDAGTPIAWWRRLACRAVWESLGSPPGAVHLNFPLRDPLVPPEGMPAPDPGRAGGAPWVARGAVDPAAAGGALAEAMSGRRRGVVVAGRAERDPALGAAIAGFADRARMPLLADPLSGARRGPAAVAHYDAFLRAPERAPGGPDLVVRLGDLPTSKPLRAWLAGPAAGARHVLLDPDSAWQDPDALAGMRLVADPGATLAAASGPAQAEEGWLERWRDADRAAARAIGTALGDELSEPAAAIETAAALGPGDVLMVAASMPVRDLETFLPVAEDGPRVLSNRGANGIDGTVSTAFGMAAAHGRVVLLTGDVALAHDIGGLLAARRLGAAPTIVVVNNDGGGIFEFLAVAAAGPAFEEHVATPHGLDLAAVAALFGLEHERVAARARLRDAVAAAVASGGGALLEVRTERCANVALHRRVWEAVAATSPGAATVTRR